MGRKSLNLTKNASWREFFRVYWLLVLLDALLIIVAISLASFEPSIRAANEQNPFTYVFHYNLFFWLFAFVDKYAGGIGAMATIAIAWFTVILARVSGRQADLIQQSISEATKATKHAETAANAAVLQVNALQASERAFLFPDFLSSNYVDWLGQPNQTLNNALLQWEFLIVNHGKTPGIVSGVRASLVIVYEQAWLDAITLDPRKIANLQGISRPANVGKERGAYSIDGQFILGPQMKTVSYVCTSGPSLRIDSKGEPAYRIKLRQNAKMRNDVIWLRGIIDYRDMFGSEHQTSFLWAFNPLVERPYEAGGPQYNYTK